MNVCVFFYCCVLSGTRYECLCLFYCCVLSGTGLSDGPITRPEESH